VDSSDLVPAVLGSIVESVSGDSLRGLVSDKLDGLHNTGNELMMTWWEEVSLIKSPKFQAGSALTSCSIPEYSPSVFSLITSHKRLLSICVSLVPGKQSD
jgi:hypothetical protein